MLLMMMIMMTMIMIVHLLSIYSARLSWALVLTWQWRSNVPKSVGGGGGGGGGGGAHRHVIFVPSVKNQYKRVVFGCMVIY